MSKDYTYTGNTFLLLIISIFFSEIHEIILYV